MVHKIITSSVFYFVLFAFITSKAFAQYIEQDSSELLYNDSVTLNNFISFKTTVQKLFKILGKPDRIKYNSYDCGQYFQKADTVVCFYYGGSCFETLKDSAVIKKIDLKKGSFKFNTGKVILSNTTTLESLKKIYPNAVKYSEELLDEKTLKKEIILKMPVQKEYGNYDNYDSQWILKFEDGYLIEISYWIPC